MAINNPSIYNAVIAGATGGAQERWLSVGAVAGDFATFLTVIQAIATEVDSLIATAAITDAQAGLMQSIAQGVFANRFPVDTLAADYVDIATSIKALWTEMGTGLTAASSNTATVTEAADTLAVPATLLGPISHILVNGEGSAADDLVTITGGFTGQVLVLSASDGANTITVKDTGNISISAATHDLDSLDDTLTLIKDASGNWYEMAFADNA